MTWPRRPWQRAMSEVRSERPATVRARLKDEDDEVEVGWRSDKVKKEGRDKEFTGDRPVKEKSEEIARRG